MRFSRTHEACSYLVYVNPLIHIIALMFLLLVLSFPRRSARACFCTSFRARRDFLVGVLNFNEWDFGHGESH